MAVGDVELSINYDRRRLQLCELVEHAGVKNPGDPEISNIGAIDLVHILESRVREVVAIVWPVQVIAVVCKRARWTERKSAGETQHHRRDYFFHCGSPGETASASSSQGLLMSIWTGSHC